MWEMALPAVASAGANLIGGLIGQDAQKDQREANERLQREFAQNAIKWKVQDAKEAGIHPAYALGAPSISPAVSVQSSPLASAVSSMGQDITRAAMATRSTDERELVFQQTMREMGLQRATLQNDLLASQIARLKQGKNPAAPSPIEEGDMVSRIARDAKGPKERTRLVMGGTEINTDPGTSDANEFTNRYGEGLGDWVFGPYIAWRDYNQHTMMPQSQRFEERRGRWHGIKYGAGRGGSMYDRQRGGD